MTPEYEYDTSNVPGAVILRSNLRVKLLPGYLKNPVPGH